MAIDWVGDGEDVNAVFCSVPPTSTSGPASSPGLNQ